METRGRWERFGGSALCMDAEMNVMTAPLYFLSANPKAGLGT